MDFSDSNGTFYTHYETFRHESDFMQDRKQLVDIIITGKVCPIFSTFLELKHGVFFFGNRLMINTWLRGALVARSSDVSA